MSNLDYIPLYYSMLIRCVICSGPGASSTGYGNLMELGPCRIAHGGGSTVENQFGWNQNASVLFVE